MYLLLQSVSNECRIFVENISMRYTILFILPFFISSCKNNNRPASTEEVSTITENKTSSTSTSSFTSISIEQAKELKNTQQDIVFLDVRTPEETNQGIIPNAIIIDMYDVDFDSKINALDKSKSYIVYCAVGGRSVSASERMKDKGFTNVYNLLGGYRAWNQ
ncbi:MAG: rhodanese-like domain-containing protein [Saprospiraceae bacterium]